VQISPEPGSKLAIKPIDDSASQDYPIGRASSSIVEIAEASGRALYIFGGHDEENNKLNDIWKFDLEAGCWIPVSTADDIYPIARSGHSAVVYGSKMFIFGGIVEITKELNDLMQFDF